MAVPAGPTEARYVGNGVTNSFTIPFLLILPTDLDVFLNGVEQTSGYVITGAGNPTSTITFTTAPAVGADVYLVLNVPFERLNDYQENGDFLASTVNRDYDRIWQALKQLYRGAVRALTLGSTDVDGRGWYRAKGNGIRDLADPVAEQDAVNFRFMRTAIEQAVAGVVGGFGWFIQAGVGAIVRTFQEKMRERVSVYDFGAIGDGDIHPLSERFGSDLAAAQAQYPFVTSLTQSIDWAGIYAAQLTGKPVDFGHGIFLCSDELLPFDSGKWFYAPPALDTWEHLDPSVPKKNSSGTHIIFYGAGAKTRTLYGVTDMRTAGGVLDNPDSVNALDTQYSLESFHNDDAADGVPSTLRQFSCGIYVKPNAQNAGIKNIRIHPNFDGIDGYNDLMTTDLGDPWDVGIFVDNAPFFNLENSQVVGYWRIKGMLVACATRTGVQGKNFFTRIKGSVIQAGLAIRGGDQSKVVAITTTIDIPWADNHPYPNSGSVNTPKGSFAFTSTNKVTGTPNGTVLRFNNVTPDPVAAVLGNGPVRISSGSGLGGMSISESVITGLDHSSMCLASNPLIGLGVSSALEISGTFRQIWIDKTYIQTREDVVGHFHAIDDLRLSQTQFEANDFRLVPGGPFSPVHGGRLICAPQDIANPLATATGDTSISMYQHHTAPYVDMFPYVPRAAGSKFSSSFAFFKPRRFQYPDLQIPDSDHLDVQALETQDIRIRMATSRATFFQDSNNVTKVTIGSSGSISLAAAAQITYGNAAAFLNIAAGQVYSIRHGTTLRWQMTAAGSWIPGQDAGQNLAAADARINNSFFAVAPTVSSDRNLKKIRGMLNDAELAACEAILPQVYQMLDMIDDKGEDVARLHFGYIAQDVQQAFIDQNLDPARYALWGEDAVTKKVKKKVKVERQKIEKVREPRERIEIRDGQPVLVHDLEEVDIPISVQVPLKNEDGSQVLDDKGHPRYASVPVMEEVEEEIEVEEPDGLRQSLRYTELQVLKEAYLCTLISKQGGLIEALEQRVKSLGG